MRQTKERRKYSLLTVTLAVTCVALILVMSLLLYVAESSTDNLEEYILSRRSAEVMSTANLLGQDIDSLYTHLYAEMTDPSLIKMRLYLEEEMYQSGYYDLTKMIFSRLAVFVRSHNLGATVELYLPAQHHVITSSTVVRTTAAEEEALYALCEEANQRVALDNGSLCFVVKRYAAETDNQVIALARLTYSVAERYLKKSSINDSGHVALMVRTQEGLERFVCSGEEISAQGQAQLMAYIGEGNRGEVQLEIDGSRCLMTWVRMEQTPILLCHVISMEMIDQQILQFRTTILLILGVVGLLLAGVIFFLYMMMLRPQKRLREAFQQVERGELSARLEESPFEECDRMFSGFNHMASRLQDLIEREYELKLLNVRAEIKEMRYQINPHFLYNTYFNLRAMLIDEDYEQALELANLLGRYLQYITASGQEEAMLKEELEHSLYYMQIQQMRFGRRVSTRVQELPAEEMQRRVPRLILQPLIENVYGHGMKNVDSGGLIAISFERQEKQLSIIVEDNGAGVGDEQLEDIRRMIVSESEQGTTAGIALRNIHRRLKLMYGKGSGLYISHSAMGGFRAEIRITEDEEHVSDADC